MSEWIKTQERTPNAEERQCLIIGVVNGTNGKIRFTDAEIPVRYDTDCEDWWSEDYDIEGCRVDMWYAVPNPPEEG